MTIKAAWATFLAAHEVLDAVAAYAHLRAACGVPDDASGRVGFDVVMSATAGSDVPHKTKSLMQMLAENWKTRPDAHSTTSRVVISGAGPVGLRAAVEAALMGQRVHVLEKRDIFSRVNILMLWQQTADDLVAYGARTFYSKFTNRNIGTSPLHLGTREIQLVFLKNALLLGVTFSYGTELVALQSPPLDAAAGWSAWARVAASTDTHQTSSGVLDFKPNKTADYSTGSGQGKCNMLQVSDLDAMFVRPVDELPPAGVKAIPFDALLLAEGEWSPTCQRLGITKSIDRFTQAIGLVINMLVDPKEPATKDPNMRSFTISPLDNVGRQLKAEGVNFEFGEFLKGETHYIVLTIKKSALLAHGALREDLPSASLLTKENLDEDALMALSRKVATVVGLPQTTQFTAFHPAKLFDFSTRARCLSGFRILALRSGGANAGQVVGMDLEAHPYLQAEETKYYARALADAEAEVAKRHREKEELEAAIKQLSSMLTGALEKAADSMVGMAQQMIESRKIESRKSSRSSGVGDDEWGDEPADDVARLEKQIESLGAANAKLAAANAGGRDEVRELSEDEERQMHEAQLEAYKRSLIELEEKTRIQEAQAAANREKQREWAAKIADTEGQCGCHVPIFPIGDSLLEPFWPQGLGSNRGFHSALDAVWAVHVMQEEGLEAALLERNFWYDLMLQGPWQNLLLKPSASWAGDPVTRYVDGAIVRTKNNYTNVQSKRLFRGAGATPPRIAAMQLKTDRSAGGHSVWK